MGQAGDRRAGQLRRDLRRQHRRGHALEHLPRPERALDPGRPAVQPALPLIPDPKTGARPTGRVPDAAHARHEGARGRSHRT
jgi:hypothetical protein